MLNVADYRWLLKMINEWLVLVVVWSILVASLVWIMLSLLIIAVHCTITRKRTSLRRNSLNRVSCSIKSLILNMNQILYNLKLYLLVIKKNLVLKLLWFYFLIWKCLPLWGFTSGVFNDSYGGGLSSFKFSILLRYYCCLLYKSCYDYLFKQSNIV